MKIYTKTGDQGNTSLFDGARVPKHHQRIEAYGTLDELNAYIGLLMSQGIAQEYKKQLGAIQNELFVLGAQLGGHSIVSYCHIARTICRRGERRATLLAENHSVPPLVIQYLNRLSDYLFVLARKLTLDLGIEEVKWVPER